VRRQRWRLATPALARALPSLMRAQNQITLKLSQTTENGAHQPTMRHFGVGYVLASDLKPAPFL